MENYENLYVIACSMIKALEGFIRTNDKAVLKGIREDGLRPLKPLMVIAAASGAFDSVSTADVVQLFEDLEEE